MSRSRSPASPTGSAASPSSSERIANEQRQRAENTLAAATDTANKLVFDLAQRFRNTVGIPATLVKDILDRARALQDQLTGSGQVTPDLRRSKAAALTEMAELLLAIGDTAGALVAARQARQIDGGLVAANPKDLDWQRALAVATEKLGDVQVALGDLAGALKSYQDDLAIARRLADAVPASALLQRDLGVAYDRVGNVQMQQGQLAAALKSYQDGLAIDLKNAQSKPQDMEAQSDLAVSYVKVGDVEVAQGHLAEALKSFQESLAVRDRLAKANPNDGDAQRQLSIAHERIGDVQVAQGDLKGAFASFEQSIAILAALAQSDAENALWQRDLTVLYERRGDVETAQGNLAAALKTYQASLADPQAAGKIRQPQRWPAGRSRRLSRQGRRRADDARQSCRRTQILPAGACPVGRLAAVGHEQCKLALQSRCCGEQSRRSAAGSGRPRWRPCLLQQSAFHCPATGEIRPSRTAVATRSLVVPQQRRRRADRARRHDECNKVIRRKPRDRSTDSGARSGEQRLQRDLSIAHGRLGNARLAQGDLAAALDLYQSGLAITERLAKSDPANAVWQRDLSVAYEKVGNVEVRQRDFAAALGHYRASLTLRQALLKADPTNAVSQRDLSIAYGDVGDVERAQGDLAAALSSYQASLGVMEASAKSDPSNAGWQRTLSISYNKAGGAALAQGDAPEALRDFRKGLSIIEALTRTNPGNTAWQRDVAVSYNLVGNVLLTQHALPEALKSYRAALDHRPTSHEQRSQQCAVAERPAILHRQNWACGLECGVDTAILRLAIDATDQAIALAPQATWLYGFLAYVLMFLGRIDEARALDRMYRGEKNVMAGKSWETVILEGFAVFKKPALPVR